MSNINWNQFSNNLFNNNINGARNVQNNTPLNQNEMPVQQQSITLETLLPRTAMQLKETTSELASLSQQQTLNLLKEMLQFPKSMELLLSQLTTNSQNLTVQTALLMLASTLDINQLSALLQNNSKEAMSNLYQMIAQYNQLGVSMKDEQLNALVKLISFVAASASSDVQTLKTTMLMYLPWLPLVDPDVLKLEIRGSGSDGSDVSDDSISLLITTENYGNIKAQIIKTDEDGIRIELISSETFPQNELMGLMKEESLKYSININFQLSTNEKYNKDRQETTKTKVFMNVSPGVNPFLLLISNSFIKNVHIIDSKENLREQRKEKINGKG